MKAKDKHRLKLLEYLGNPENEFLNRVRLAIEVLEFSKRESLYQSFTVDDLDEIEAEALEIRRKKYKPGLATADKALLDKAKDGDVSAIKLCYQRFEDWSEKQKHEIGGRNNGPIPIQIITTIPDPDPPVAE